MLLDGQGTKCHKNIADNLNHLSRAHEGYRRQTDGRATANSEREHEREFTFANNNLSSLITNHFNSLVEQSVYVCVCVCGQ